MAATVFETLEHVIWIPSDLERRFLAEYSSEEPTASLTPFALGSNDLRWLDMSVTLGPDHLELKQFDLTFGLPKGGDRGATVGVLSLYGQQPGKVTYSAELSAVGSLVQVNEHARRQADTILETAPNALVTWWRRRVTADLIVDQQADSVASNLGLVRTHAAGSGLQLETAFTPTAVEVIDGECGSCHQTAVQMWRKSAHSKAMVTLTSRLRHRDLRCLSCHAQEYDVTNSGGTARHGLDAVTCASCHENESKPDQSCVRCHTRLTDPRGKFQHHRHDICADAVTQGSGSCKR